MWMPPLPGGVLDQPAEPGLRVTYADDGFLLATKLIAQRAKDADDVVALAGRLGLSTATPEQLETHIRRYYTDPRTAGVDRRRPRRRPRDQPARPGRLPDASPHGACGRRRRRPPSSGRGPREPTGFGAVSTARNALPDPDVTPWAADPPRTADHSSCLDPGVRGLPSSPRRMPVERWTTGQKGLAELARRARAAPGRAGEGGGGRLAGRRGQPAGVLRRQLNTGPARGDPRHKGVVPLPFSA
jgi:hypothetical protein